MPIPSLWRAADDDRSTVVFPVSNCQARIWRRRRSVWSYWYEIADPHAGFRRLHRCRPTGAATLKTYLASADVFATANPVGPPSQATGVND